MHSIVINMILIYIFLLHLLNFLKVSGISGEVIAAVDINPHANIVYKHNFKETKVLQKTIEVN